MSEALSQYLEDLSASSTPARSFALRDPLRTARMLLALGGLPKVRVRLTDSPEGALIAKWLTRGRGPRTSLHYAVTALPIPRTLDEFTAGSSKQTLRRKVREAQKRGVTWRPIDDVGERQRLLQRGYDREKSHPDPRYRRADPDNSELLKVRLWLAAYAADGAPLLTAVIPVDGDWSLLRYFMVLVDSPDASAARYLMTQVVVEHLAARGVKYLVDPASPFRLPNGLRQFQRMLGFTMLSARAPRPSTARLSAHGLTWRK